MSFLNPIALWGLLAISIPIFIHLWNGKRGKTIAWAAMNFLTAEESRVSKGIKLENLLILMLRIGLLVLLILLLAQLFWEKEKIAGEKKIIHLIMPERELLEEFRFEIQQAQEREEQVILARSPIVEIGSLDDFSILEQNESPNLQAALDQLPDDLDSLILYLPNSNLALEAYFYSLAIMPEIKVGIQSSQTSGSQTLKTGENSYINVSESGLLIASSGGEVSSKEFDFSEKSIGYFVQGTASEMKAIDAAINAIREVYGFNFQRTSSLDSATLVFSEEKLSKSNPEKLYFLSNSLAYSESENQIHGFDDSELVRNARLPEFILEKFLAFSGVEKAENPLNEETLKARFLVKDKGLNQQQANLNEYLLILLLGTLILERYLALKNGI